MLIDDENLSLPMASDLDQLISESRQAYVDFLSSLRAAIHLDDGSETVTAALESLVSIGECWTVAREIHGQTSPGLPFARQSEIDLAITLLGLASYSYPFIEAFHELRVAFVETINSIRSTPQSHPLPA